MKKKCIPLCPATLCALLSSRTIEAQCALSATGRAGANGDYNTTLSLEGYATDNIVQLATINSATSLTLPGSNQAVTGDATKPIVIPMCTRAPGRWKNVPAARAIFSSPPPICPAECIFSPWTERRINLLRNK